MFEEIKKELKGKSDIAISWYLKSIDLSSVIQYLKENSTYNDISEKRKFKLIQDFLKGRNNICPVCGKIIEHDRMNCSMKCRNLNPEIQKRRKETCIKKYGVENVFQNKEVQEKIKNTNIEKYGTEFALQNKDVQKKGRETCLKKYGTEFALQNKEVQKKKKETCIKKYGVEFALQNKEVREKVKNTCRERYGVVNPSQSKIKNYDLYYDKNYIRENLFLDTCTPNTKAIQEFFNISGFAGVQHMRELFGDEIHYYSGTSSAERELQDYVKTLTENVRCNDRTIISPKELDIVLPDVKLCIEYDGSYWHSDKVKGQNYHLEKTKLCAEKGYQLFHIFEFDDIEIWKSMISNKLRRNKVIYARKCIIRELKYKEVKCFLAENHLQGTCSSKINLGLFYNDELVEVMTFGKPRFNKNYDFELLRLCTKKYYSVVGGTSKLFKYFTSKYKGSIISYANRRFSNGNIYRQLEFKEVKSTSPNYFYIKGDIVLTRYQCQKHKLKDLYNKGILKEYDSELTESEIMDRNLYFRLYDCGNLVFEYR